VFDDLAGQPGVIGVQVPGLSPETGVGVPQPLAGGQTASPDELPKPRIPLEA